MNGPEQPGINHLGVFQNCFNEFKDGYNTQNYGQNYFVASNQVNCDLYSSTGHNYYTDTPDAWNSLTAPNHNAYTNLPPPQAQAPVPCPSSTPTAPVPGSLGPGTINTPSLQGPEGPDSWATSYHGFMEERLDDAIGILQKHAESSNYYPQIDCHGSSLAFSNSGQSITLSNTPLSVQPHDLKYSKEGDFKPVKTIKKKKANRKKESNNNKKSASGYAHFFRERQARIKEENKSASFGEISKIVASEWEALSIGEKAVYKRKAEYEKNNQFKDIALNHAMVVAGIK